MLSRSFVMFTFESDKRLLFAHTVFVCNSQASSFLNRIDGLAATVRHSAIYLYGLLLNICVGSCLTDNSIVNELNSICLFEQQSE